MNEETRYIWQLREGDGAGCLCVVTDRALRSGAPGQRGFRRAAGRCQKVLQRGGYPIRRYLLHALSRARSTEGGNQLRAGPQETWRNCVQQTVEAGGCDREIP